jgi:hypothetical protein
MIPAERKRRAPAGITDPGYSIPFAAVVILATGFPAPTAQFIPSLGQRPRKRDQREIRQR